MLRTLKDLMKAFHDNYCHIGQERLYYPLIQYTLSCRLAARWWAVADFPNWLGILRTDR